MAEEYGADDVQTALQALSDCGDALALQRWRSAYLGKKSQLNQALRQLSVLTQTERIKRGHSLNKLKVMLQSAYEERQHDIEQNKQDETDDWSLPICADTFGLAHPIEKVLTDIRAFF